ncbi:MAG: peptidoglycan-associated lipoprotein Pal [Rhizobiales bacterium]|nr:peptidoglycan-associated lipoprotein Pal [Hyphomicrobiales bacterium]
MFSRFAAISAVALLAAGCANQAASPTADLANGGYGSSGPVTPGTERDFSVNVGTTVYFTTDSTDLTPEAQQTLQKQALWLNQYPQYTITLEGHADERGTREYNIALGARRAETVRSFLTGQGVQPQRMRTISFGKERPVAVCNDISCWSQNRRSHTLLNNRSSS